MTGLVEFLTARLDEDEQAAQLAKARSTGRWYVYDDGVVVEWDGEDAGDGTPRVPNRHTGYFLMYDAGRALAEVAAKRLLIGEIESYEAKIEGEWGSGRAGGGFGDWESALRFLAAPYADHPDFDESWRVAAIVDGREAP